MLRITSLEVDDFAGASRLMKSFPGIDEPTNHTRRFFVGEAIWNGAVVSAETMVIPSPFAGKGGHGFARLYILGSRCAG